MHYQRTLKRPVTLVGVGLHSGKDARVSLRPAAPDQGLRFVRTDLSPSVEIAAHYKNIVNTQLATTLGKGKVTVGTVEHLLAALHGLRVDNVVIEVNGPEIPIMDGSSAPFVDAIRDAGIEPQVRARAVLALRKRVEVKINEKWAVAEPSDRLEIHASIDWDHPAIGFQELSYVEGEASFEKLAGARTFGFMRDVEALQRMGLARGGSLGNVVVLDDAAVLNPEGLRYPDEFVRHKVLDALGDFMLAGIVPRARFRLHRAGHDLHRQLIAEILGNPEHFEIVDSVPTPERRIARARSVLTGRWAATF